MSATFSVVILLLHSLSSGSPAIIGEEDVIGDGPHFDLFDFPFADPVMWAADSGNASDDLGGFQGEKSPSDRIVIKSSSCVLDQLIMYILFSQDR